MGTVQAVRWREFEAAAPELGDFGRQRLQAGPCNLGTVRRDGSARVHPVSPKVVRGNLVLYMYPTSPKGADLARDPRFALHATVDDDHGTGGEFSLRGIARRVNDDALGKELAPGGFPAQDRYIRFELLISSVLAGTYGEGAEKPHLRRWSAPTR
ncbi:pyridoxamine 5'-phosphate oxidase family protein [Saccharopolyspora elongata]|uniref:Pyridoxamine 5'-phosphate oxidase n=1 Tax=Saccharopolyspora elongata TaxID=2530387 RepID=A0A4R4YZ64_9PSEU|nr:pyridoxamine 5'-phosphate oxidase family protein [Saccharopolyspora elongata]TDD50300.1 pyridoxamine 5'-phosphate oxidase [Saccharopolyspora elongata]